MTTSVIDTEPDKTTRWLREAIWIRRREENTLNKDNGAYKLQNICDQLVQTLPTTPSMSTKKGYKRQFDIEHGHQSDEAPRLGVKQN